ncbi:MULTISPECIES: hypothetical protein [Pseudoalteromonas]|uniref:hypothetical protein n=1 Tax=Pseudoalteromonas TaxID=53246 RepID=UPI000C345C35|nr:MULTISPECIES: hypothetical protein [Pseudoalteromonas]PKG65441.1 hypothetical protein CXF75_07560 [Pseudoalteromonas arctica]PKG69565.1 hypothetical protein CXF64_15345 [Pseudoalteromonas sp. GutCa3]
MKLNYLHFFWFSIILVPALNPLSEGISTYFPLKLLFLILAVVLCIIKDRNIRVTKVDLAIYLYFFYSLLSFYWGDLSPETSIMYFGFWLSYLLTFFFIRTSKLMLESKFIHIILALSFELILYFTLYDGNKSVNGGYVVGHLTSVLLLLNYRIGHFLKTFFLLLLLNFTGIRFVGVLLISYFKRPIFILFAGVLGIVLLYYITNMFIGTSIYTYLLGYRVAEPSYVLNSISKSPVEIFFGHGFGSDSFTVRMGSKGVIQHSGIFHNFYLTVLYNTGVIGVLLLLATLICALNSSKKCFYAIGLVAFILMSSIDSHRDGVWAIFLFLALLLNERDEKILNE